VIVRAPLYDNGQTDEGAVFVYYGSSTGIHNPESWFAESDQAGAQFGYSVAATDLTFLPDFYSDIVVGAPYWDYASSDVGGVFVWYGGASGLGPNGIPSNAGDIVVVDLTNVGTHSGWSVAAGANMKYSQHPGIIIGVPDEASGGLTGSGNASAWYKP